MEPAGMRSRVLHIYLRNICKISICVSVDLVWLFESLDWSIRYIIFSIISIYLNPLQNATLRRIVQALLRALGESHREDHVAWRRWSSTICRFCFLSCSSLVLISLSRTIRKLISCFVLCRAIVLALTILRKESSISNAPQVYFQPNIGLVLK